MKTQLSIVMPTYNRAHPYLPEAISSILYQDFKDFELIIVDDASTDETESVVKAFNDKRILYIKTSQNHGEYWSTNYGVNLAHSPYLTWVHSDDVLPQGSLSRRIEGLSTNKNIDFVHGDIEKIDERGNSVEIIKAIDMKKEEILSAYLDSRTEKAKYPIHHTTVMMKWNFFYKAGPFDCSLPFAGDIDWLIRAIKSGNFKYIDSLLYKYRSHSGTRRIVDIQNGVNKEKTLAMIKRRYIPNS